MSSVVLLCTPCTASNVVYWELARRFDDVVVVEEAPVSRRQLIARRVQRLGAFQVLGQLLFQVGVSPWLSRGGRARTRAILRSANVSDEAIPAAAIRRVPSVNAPEARELLQTLDPAVVVVNGTRIIGRQMLASVQAPFVNLHAGITPAYRGVHGAYWALVDQRPDLAGVTVHRVDSGIDTGEIIAQARVTPSAEDTFATYPTLQLVAGLPLLLDAVEALLAGRPPATTVIPAESAPLRYHPTVWRYLASRFGRGVR